MLSFVEEMQKCRKITLELFSFRHFSRNKLGIGMWYNDNIIFSHPQAFRGLFLNKNSYYHYCVTLKYIFNDKVRLEASCSKKLKLHLIDRNLCFDIISPN